MNLNGSDLVMITRVERPRAIVIDPCNGQFLPSQFWDSVFDIHLRCRHLVLHGLG